jgi:hypothetical protein
VGSLPSDIGGERSYIADLEIYDDRAADTKKPDNLGVTLIAAQKVKDRPGLLGVKASEDLL